MCVKKVLVMVSNQDFITALDLYQISDFLVAIEWYSLQVSAVNAA